MKINPYHIFNYENTFFLINGEILSTVVIDVETANILKMINKKDRNALFDNYDLLNGLGLINNSSSQKVTKKSIKYPSITHITMFVSQKCNLDCIYCYGDGGKYGHEGLMRTNIALKAVDWLIAQSREKAQLGISFFGGEPLMNFSLIKTVVQYATNQANSCGKNIEFGITTNATLLDSDKIEFFKQYKIIPIVSFDGPKSFQNKHRPFKNGKGSYDCVYKNIKNLLKIMPDSICRATLIDSTNHSYIENELQKVGFKRIQLTVASPSLFGNEIEIKRNINGMRECLNDQAIDILNAINNRNSGYIKKIRHSGLGWHLCRMIEQFINKQKRYFSCGAGRSGIAISINGEVHLCHRFVGVKQYSLGYVFDNNIKRDLYQISPAKNNKQCIECFSKYFCAGGCYHDNLGMTGDIFRPAYDMCSFMRTLTSYAGMISCKLKEKDVEYLVQNEIIAKKICLLDIF